MTARDRTPIVHAPGVLAIPLTRGLFALIDEADAPIVARHLWCAMPSLSTHYATRGAPGRKTVYMHRLIMGSPALDVDHIDRDGLNNTRSNLRLATESQNLHNAKKQKNNTSGFRGVTWCKRSERWIAEAYINSHHIHIGAFRSIHDAAEARDAYVLKAMGVFAFHNT